MESHETVAACKKYFELLYPEYLPAKMPDDTGEYSPETRHIWLQHACYMSQMIPSFILNQRSINKINRWYGYMQCICNMAGVNNLRDAKLTNMPPGSVYDRDAK